MVDVDYGIANAEAGGLCLGHRECESHCGIARTTTCLESFRRGQANGMAEGPLKEGDPSVLLTMRKIVQAAYCTQVEVSEREEDHERYKSVLEAGGSLEHKKDWLHLSSQSSV